MTLAKNERGNNPPDVSWAFQSDTPTPDTVTLIFGDLQAFQLAAHMLITEADRYPDSIGLTQLHRPLPAINREIQNRLLWIGTQLLSMNALAITTTTSASPDDDFHLVTTQPTPGTFVITLQVPTLATGGGEIEMRVDGGYIQWRWDGGTWHNLILVEDLRGSQGEPGEPGEPGEQGERGEQGLNGLTGLTGAQGAPGIDGVDGEDCDCDSTPPPPPPENDENDYLCNIAISIASYIDSIFDDILAILESTGDLSGLAGGIIDLVGGDLAANVTEFASSIFSTGASTLRAAVTTDLINEWVCQHYCIMVANGGYTYDGLREWYDLIAGEQAGNIGAQAWIRIMDIRTENFWGQRAYVASLTINNGCEACDCDDEPEDCQYWLNGEGKGAWFAIDHNTGLPADTTGVYNATEDRWEGVYRSAQGHKGVFIALPGDITIGQLNITYNINPTRGGGKYLRVYNNEATLILDASIIAGNATAEWTPETPISGHNIWIYLAAATYGDEDGHAWIEAITICPEAIIP